jgi:hypothetical protein
VKVRTTSIAVWVSAVVIAAAALAVGLAVGTREGLSSDAVLNVIAVVVYTALGLLLAVRQPGNKVAWLFYVVALWGVLNGASRIALGDESVPPNPVGVWDVLAIAWGNAGYFVAFLIPLLLLFYIFPTGRFLKRRWSWAGWTAGLMVPVALFVGIFPKEIGPDTGTWTVSNPIGFLDINPTGLGGGFLGVVFSIGFLALGFGAIPAIIVRYRRSDAQVRAQIKWVVYALLMIAASLMAASLPGVPGWAGSVLFAVMLFAAPVSVTLAITRYRLYDIDRIISRTFGYLIVVAVLGAVYGVGAVWIPTAIFGDQSSLFVAASTLGAAALFNPVRRFVLDRVDRRFNRSRYDAQQVIDGFADRLRDKLDVPQLTAESMSLVSEVMQPSAVAMWVPSRETQ